MKDDFGYDVKPPETVAVTIKILELLQANFTVLEDFHPSFTDSLTVIDTETNSGVTLVIVESSS